MTPPPMTRHAHAAAGPLAQWLADEALLKGARPLLGGEEGEEGVSPH
jgi:hypothetical protein